ncbi:hypothetical protein LEA_01184, partial [human gut metagenome]
MTFTQIPEQYTALGSEAIYVVESPEAADIDLRLVASDGTTCLGMRRYVGVREARCDAAPLLRRALRFEPADDETGFTPAAGRTVTATAEAAPAGSFPDRAEATAPARIFLAGPAGPTEPALRTTMPAERIIPAGAGEEISITMPEFGSVAAAVTVRSGDRTEFHRYEASSAGLFLFRLDLKDFPDAEEVTLDFGTMGTIHYTVVPARSESCRLAWRNSIGSVEHYTFPVVREVRLRTEKNRAENRRGYAARIGGQERLTRIESAY